jgi:hypothetical protein
MTTAELQAIVVAVEKRHDQYKARLNNLGRTIRTVEADEQFKELDHSSYTALIEEAQEVYLGFTKHLRLYSPIVTLVKELLGRTEPPSTEYYRLLGEHYACVLSVTEAHLADVEDYTDLVVEAHALYLESLS